MVEAGKKLPRKFLRLAESFEANHTSDIAFCNSYRKWFQIWFFYFDKIIHIKNEESLVSILTLSVS